MTYGVEVEAESFYQAAEKALEYAQKSNRNNIEHRFVEAARRIVPDKMSLDVNSTVELVQVHGE